jgi:hypothetical protein
MNDIKIPDSMPDWIRDHVALYLKDGEAGHYWVRPWVAEDAEREKLWQLMVDYYAPYTDYQAATPWQIPVVVLDPV